VKRLKTLLIDLDPQTNATFSCITPEKWQTHAAKYGTVANLLGVRQHTTAEGKEKSASGVIIPNVFTSVDLIPSHLDLFTIDLDVGSEVARETKLRRALKDVVGNYEVIVCDCPPNLTIPTQNALALSTHYVVPVSPDFLSSLGVALLLSRVNKLSDELETPIKLVGIAICRVGRTSVFRTQTIQSLRSQFGADILTSQITERAKVAESAALNRSIFEMGDAQASREFSDLGNEILNRM
jgi:chromosome partitioning protein